MRACPLEDELPEELVAEELPDPQDASKVPANMMSSRTLIRGTNGFFILWSFSIIFKFGLFYLNQ
jgi:hypothetical protein